MWPTGYVSLRRVTGDCAPREDDPPYPDGTGPLGPAMTTLRSVVAYLATMIRCAGIAYVIVQVILWHSFYVGSAWRLMVPTLAVAWAAMAAIYLRRHWPSEWLACIDCAVYLALALGAQGCVPSAVRDNAFSWLVISMSGQLIVPAWYAPSVLSVPLAVGLPLAYWGGAMLQPVTDMRTLTGSVTLLLIVGLVHAGGRRMLYRRAAAADADLARADRAAARRCAVLCGDIERREHERLVHDTVLNTLTALARSGGAVAGVVARCRQDVALIEAALGADDLAGDSARPSVDLRDEVRSVAATMRARGLIVHLETDDAEQVAIPARVVAAIANAVREALSNAAVHAGTGEAWVSIRQAAPEDDADVPRLRVVVRDEGAGFDPVRAGETRLGLRKSITERTAECGGQASIRSAPGQGTEVSLLWPAPEPPDLVTAADRTLAARGLPW